MSRRRIPDEVLSAAHSRARAREAGDWAEADRLRAEIEASGWKIADRGTDFALTPVAPPDVVEGARVRYGSSVSVPTRLDAPDTGLVSVVLIATDWPDDLERALAGLRTASPAGTSVVIVADAPSPEQTLALEAWEAPAALAALAAPEAPAALAAPEAPEAQGAPEGAAPSGLPIEIVWTGERLGLAAATNIGLRRAMAPVVVLLDTSLEPTGDILTPLVRTLDDPTVAVAGDRGIISTDLRKFSDAPPGDADAIGGHLQAFRRADCAARGPLDEHFRFYPNMDIWWSLVLRDEGQGSPPRRAVGIAGLPVVRHAQRGYVNLPDDERDRQSKRNFYRVVDRFGSRRDLLVSR